MAKKKERQTKAKTKKIPKQTPVKSANKENIDVFNDKNNVEKQNINDFKRNSNMVGLDFFTGSEETNNNKNNIQKNPFANLTIR